jgi:tetratricopeptide (TPR) repeat protein
VTRTRLHLACDHCGAAAWLGPRVGDAADASVDAWCEACQLAQSAPGAGAPCARCGTPLTAGAPRFAELWGALQECDAVLAAWTGDPQPLRTLLPERPRFLTDLAPPAIDDAEPVTALVARGDYAGALAAAQPATSQGWAARAIAHERRGDFAAAIADWSRVLDAADEAHASRARLARGSLHARAGAWDAAEADLAHAGDGFEARWDRAAVRVHRAVEITPGLPDPTIITRAQADVGEVTPYWSDPTIARLLWTLLVERSLERQGPMRSDCPDVRVLRAAESFFEFDSFWDRAMMLLGWTRVNVAREVARHASMLAEAHLHALTLEPPLRGQALAPLAAAIEAARRAVHLREPAAARAALAPMLGRADLRHYRLPCAVCGVGSVGVDGVEEECGDEDETAL